MKTITSTTGYVVEELEEGVDTEDITVTALDDLADQWERLCDVFAAGDQCPSCVHYEATWNFATRRLERECDVLDPRGCPALNARAIANAFRRQAS